MVPYERLNATPLQGLQMRNLKSMDDLSVVYDELHKCKVLESYQASEFYKRAEAFVQRLKARDYWRNAFPDLREGDCVRFKTTKTKINVFPDLGRARNIYPDDLVKL